MSDIDWFCDDCNDYLNNQSGFHDDCGNWTCTTCGHVNPINENEIIDEDKLAEDEDDYVDPEQITVNCPICMAELEAWSDVDQAYCPTCDMTVEI